MITSKIQAEIFSLNQESNFKLNSSQIAISLSPRGVEKLKIELRDSPFVLPDFIDDTLNLFGVNMYRNEDQVKDFVIIKSKLF